MGWIKVIYSLQNHKKCYNSKSAFYINAILNLQILMAEELVLSFTSL